MCETSTEATDSAMSPQPDFITAEDLRNSFLVSCLIWESKLRYSSAAVSAADRWIKNTRLLNRRAKHRRGRRSAYHDGSRLLFISYCVFSKNTMTDIIIFISFCFLFSTENTPSFQVHFHSDRFIGLNCDCSSQAAFAVCRMVSVTDFQDWVLCCFVRT